MCSCLLRRASAEDTVEIAQLACGTAAAEADVSAAVPQRRAVRLFTALLCPTQSRGTILLRYDGISCLIAGHGEHESL